MYSRKPLNVDKMRVYIADTFVELDGPKICRSVVGVLQDCMNSDGF
jgi:hypothetical protein